MPQQLNFTQYAISQGAPSDYCITDHSSLSPSGRRTKIGEKRSTLALLDRMDRNSRAKADYRELILSGDIVDPDGEYVKQEMLDRTRRHEVKQAESQLQVIGSKTDFINSLGSMSHKKNGQLRKGFQSQRDELTTEREIVQAKLLILGA